MYVTIYLFPNDIIPKIWVDLSSISPKQLLAEATDNEESESPVP